MALGLGIAILVLQIFAPLVWQALEQLALNVLSIATDALATVATLLHSLPTSP